MVVNPLIPDIAATRSLREAETAVAALGATLSVASTAATLPPGGDWMPAVPAMPASFLSYQLGPKIGEGGMGSVYQATHRWLGRTVAIKFITPHLFDSPEMAERFRHEALAIGRLNHPNIVQATDAGRFEAHHFLVTEFVDGGDLDAIVRRRGRLEISDACEAIRQAALGLAHAHEHGVVHRDVKPGNLLLTKDGTVKVLDFGLARLASRQTMLTNTGQVLGTLDFLAPEQAHDARQVDPRCDQYSLGCSLYFLLTGEPPFSGPSYDTPASKLKAHLIDHPRPIGELRHRVPLGLAAILDRMLAKSPADRFANLEEVAEQLSRHCRGAELAELVGGRSQRGRPAGACSQSNAADFCEALFSTFGAMVRNLLWRRKPAQPSQPTYRAPAFSLSGLAVLAFVAFVLSRVSCVEFKEEGPIQPNGKPQESKIIEFGFGRLPPVLPDRTAPIRGDQGR
jgi:serine/threonine protein kinase